MILSNSDFWMCVCTCACMASAQKYRGALRWRCVYLLLYYFSYLTFHDTPLLDRQFIFATLIWLHPLIKTLYTPSDSRTNRTTWKSPGRTPGQSRHFILHKSLSDYPIPSSFPHLSRVRRLPLIVIDIGRLWGLCSRSEQTWHRELSFPIREPSQREGVLAKARSYSKEEKNVW